MDSAHQTTSNTIGLINIIFSFYWKTIIFHYKPLESFENGVRQTIDRPESKNANFIEISAYLCSEKIKV